MCNWKKWFWPGVVAVALLTALTGWFRSGPVENDLTARATEQLKASQGWSGISFNGRDATLTGVAENDAQKVSAAKFALGTYGVRVLVDQTKLPAKADPYVLSAIKDDKGVTLSGNYDTTETRAALLDAAAKAMPGIAITDKLGLASGKPDGFDVLAGFGVSQLADLTSGEINLSNLNYSIKGTPVDLDTYARVLTAASGVLPGKGALKAAEVTLPALGRPYELSASYDGASVNLTGYAPSKEVSAAIEAKAKTLFPEKTVTNSLVLAAGAAPNFADLATFGLTQLALLENGTFSFNDLNYNVKGTPASAASYDVAVKTTVETLPAGVTLGSVDLVKPSAPVIEPAPAPEPAKPYVWSAANTANVLTITGSVPNPEVAAKNIELATQRFVKTEITDGQSLLDRAPEGVADAQAAALKALAALEEGTVTITDKAVSLEGKVSSQAVSTFVIAKTKERLPAGYELTANLNIAQPVAVATTAPAKPYIWSATASTTGVRLEGSVLSGDIGASLYELAQMRFVKSEVTNAQLPLNNSPANYAQAQDIALKSLSYLSEGQVALTDKAVTISGVAPAESIKTYVEKKLADGLPDGYTSTSNIEVVAPEIVAPVVLKPAPAPALVANSCIADISALLSSSQINFEVNMAIVKDESKALLDSIAAKVAECADVKMQIAGHTDSDGKDASNLSLSQARADAVRAYMVGKSINAARLTAKGYGEVEPLVANDTPENKAKNRRIEFRLVQ